MSRTRDKDDDHEPDHRAADVSVVGMSCGHCRAAITAEVEQLAGVTSVDIDLPAKRVSVAGDELDDAAIRAAIDEAGYDVA